MAIYSKKKLLAASVSQIPQMAEAIRKDFESDGFEVNVDNLISGGCDISVTKGGMFKAVLGMRSALKITLVPQTDGVLFDANVGIYGQQAVPTVISMLFFWPVIITQIWGLVEQSQLDDRALKVAEKVVGSSSVATTASESCKFCTNCGSRISASAKFCPECGEKL